SWQQGTGANTQAEQDAREISAKLFDIFPELRDGLLPMDGDDEEGGMRGCVRQLLTGASLVAAFREVGINNQESAMEYKQMLKIMSALEPVHQAIIWSVYWQGQSMRSLAEEWELDDLSVIREHKEILQHLSEEMEAGGKRPPKALKVRRGLKNLVLKLKKNNDKGAFTQMLGNLASIIIICFAILSSSIFPLTTFLSKLGL
ncbi:MAG: hypothetical protein KBC84_09970, partial [Proteobacteria bacterium]|nr:hypothetical protein [Pseudomonadota bacterium]